MIDILAIEYMSIPLVDKSLQPDLARICRPGPHTHALKTPPQIRYDFGVVGPESSCKPSIYIFFLPE